MTAAIVFLILFFLFVGWLLLMKPRTGKEATAFLLPYRYAHRGWHDKPQIPENSLAAFRRAADSGFAAELDIHLTADGRLAVIHDSDISRVTGGTGIVEKMTADELAQYRLEGTEEKIPYLEQVLPLFAGVSPLLIELKVYEGNQAALCEAAAALLDNYPGQFCVESFQPQALLWLKKNRPEWIRGQLVCDLKRAGESHGAIQNFIFSNLLMNAITKPDFIAYQFEDRRNLSNRLCRRFYAAPEFNWTIRTPQDQKEAERNGRVIIFEQYDPRQKAQN